MSNPITTKTFSSGDVVTYHQSGQSQRDWVQDHTNALKNKTVTGDLLTTIWTSANGLQETATSREMGPPIETDDHFISRHAGDYTAALANENPTP